MLIGLCGTCRQETDFVANVLHRAYRFRLMSFDVDLYTKSEELIGFTQVDQKENFDIALDAQMLHLKSRTETVREEEDNLWLKLLAIPFENRKKNVVFSDVTTVEEADFIKKLGGFLYGVQFAGSKKSTISCDQDILLAENSLDEVRPILYKLINAQRSYKKPKK